MGRHTVLVVLGGNGCDSLLYLWWIRNREAGPAMSRFPSANSSVGHTPMKRWQTRPAVDEFLICGCVLNGDQDRKHCGVLSELYKQFMALPKYGKRTIEQEQQAQQLDGLIVAHRLGPQYTHPYPAVVVR